MQNISLFPFVSSIHLLSWVCLFSFLVFDILAAVIPQFRPAIVSPIMLQRLLLPLSSYGCKCGFVYHGLRGRIGE